MAIYSYNNILTIGGVFPSDTCMLLLRIMIIKSKLLVFQTMIVYYIATKWWHCAIVLDYVVPRTYMSTAKHDELALFNLFYYVLYTAIYHTRLHIYW